MRRFLEATFGPTELDMLDDLLAGWLAMSGHSRESTDAELAAAIIINLFREGHDTYDALQTAMSRHQALKALEPLSQLYKQAV
jgi:hypothetical protein